MPNYCDYEIKIKGSKNAIKKVVKTLKADYDYTKGKPQHEHLFRVFDVQYDLENMEKNSDGTFTLYVSGYCAWSVYSCMCEGINTYYNSVKENHPDIFMGTTLGKLTLEYDCEIEVFSEEIDGMFFSEHYLFKKGMRIINDTCEITQMGLDDNGYPIKIEDWDNYDGDETYLNPHRNGWEMPFAWTI